MITKSATSKTNCTMDLRFTRNARAAWGHIIDSFSVITQPNILLPAYIGITDREGSGVFDPVEASGAAYQFYQVGEDLSPDLEDFEAKIRGGEINLALIIHYFGFCRTDLAYIKALCSEYGVILVEDCAHAFTLDPTPGTIGSFGDFSFYSLHKYLATDSGGILRNNQTHLELLTLEEENRASYEVLEQYARTQLDRVATVRRANFAQYTNLLAGQANLLPMHVLTEGDVPQTFPVLVQKGLRERLYFDLMAHALPTTALYYRLIEPITPRAYPLSHRISGEILNLPVHQDTSQNDIEILCAAIHRFFTA